jgi:hypothetical protein
MTPSAASTHCYHVAPSLTELSALLTTLVMCTSVGMTFVLGKHEFTVAPVTDAMAEEVLRMMFPDHIHGGAPPHESVALRARYPSLAYCCGVSKRAVC